MDNRSEDLIRRVSEYVMPHLGIALTIRVGDVISNRVLVQKSTPPSLLHSRHEKGSMDPLGWTDGPTDNSRRFLTDGGRDSDDIIPGGGRGDTPGEDTYLNSVRSRDLSVSRDTGATAERTRQRLKRAFDHHLHRVVKGETALVAVRIATPTPTGTYRYLDNGSDRGGAHYFRDLTPQTKAEIISCASAAGLTVLIDGPEYVSVSFETEAVEEDVQFVESVLVNGFDVTVADIISIEEVIDYEESREWLY